jgi:hypothetical protein
MTEKYFIRIHEFNSKKCGQPGIAIGKQSVIVEELAKLGFGISEMARGDKRDLIRVTLGQIKGVVK